MNHHLKINWQKRMIGDKDKKTHPSAIGRLKQLAMMPQAKSHPPARWSLRNAPRWTFFCIHFRIQCHWSQMNIYNRLHINEWMVGLCLLHIFGCRSHTWPITSLPCAVYLKRLSESYSMTITWRKNWPLFWSKSFVQISVYQQCRAVLILLPV